METPSLRVRLVFEDRSILDRTQRSEGMNRSWMLLKPQQHRKISDVCAHLLHIFNLRRSCPNGILLSMEGFVLPPFESTRILKDKEIICVKRKVGALTDTIEAEDAGNLIDEVEVEGIEPVDDGVLLLANEEFDKETGGYESESDEADEGQLEDEVSPEGVSKKRKASAKLHSSKKKKQCLGVLDGAEAEVKRKETDNVNNDESLPRKINRKKEKISNCKSKTKDKTDLGSAETSNKKIESPSDIERSEEPEDNAEVEGVKQVSTAPDEVKKVPSRSARRKKAKRRWMRELAKISKKKPHPHPKPEVAKAENKEADGRPKGLLHWKQEPKKHVHKNVIEQKETNPNGDAETEVVPVVIRPGHIRFEPLDEDQVAKEAKVSNGVFQWNGITNKKKGQKWGTEKFSAQKTKRESSKTMTAIDTEVPIIDLNEFDKLPPCSSPKEGDVIAYRLLELSSSWTPELSSFRVGRISYYDARNIVLIPVPEYPIVSDKTDEDGPDNSLYGEDGTLEIKFSALVDVRNVKQTNSDVMRAVSNVADQTPQGDDKGAAADLVSNSNNKNAAADLVSNSNDNKTNVSQDSNPVVENKEVDPWDQLGEALNAKKSELLEENEEIKTSSGRDPWSYRALRGSALGPTMALLRSKNSI